MEIGQKIGEKKHTKAVKAKSLPYVPAGPADGAGAIIIIVFYHKKVLTKYSQKEGSTCEYFVTQACSMKLL